MAVLTPLSLDDAKRIGARFGLAVARVTGILAGSVNSNYRLDLVGGGSVFLRVYEEQTMATAAREAKLLDELASRGVPTPRPLLHDEGFLEEHEGKPVAVFPWIEGDIVCQARVDEARMERVGAALARVHVAGRGLDAPASRFDVLALRERISFLRSARRTDEIERAIDRLERALMELAARDVEPGGLVHADLFRDNVLWNGSELVALLDFESACRESFAFDLAVVMLSWCFGASLDLDLARALVRGYESVRTLAREDRARFFADARFAAARFSITRITDFELRPQGTGVRKDFRRFLARMDALDHSGERQLLEALALAPVNARGAI